ncbi:MAG: thiamine pyrophosphate-dependent enzyme [bacterium]|nr:thiamine pyrophosphate-dependent enzyme [bacterium]
MVTAKDFTGEESAWCPGCGNFGILTALQKALAELNLEPQQVLLVSGIGQASKLPHYARGHVFNGLHSPAIPPAIAAKLVNHELNVIITDGDGGTYGEGGNHFIHALRRNPDITLIVHNNQVYGLTKGQASPTTDQGVVTKIQAHGVPVPAFNPLAVAIALNASFVARGFVGEPEHLKNLIKEGIQHKGLSLIDVLQPCVSFNKINTYQWYRQRAYKLPGDYDPKNKAGAMEKANEWGDHIPLGVLYLNPRLVYEEQIPVLKNGPLVKQKIDTSKIVKVLEEFC